MDEPVEAHYACHRELGDADRLRLMENIWTTDQQITALLEEHGYPMGAERMLIEMGIVTILECIERLISGPMEGESFDLQVEFGVMQHVDLVHSPSNPVPVISFYTLDMILNGLNWPKTVRLVRAGLRGTNSRLDKETIRQLQMFISKVISGLLNKTPV